MKIRPNSRKTKEMLIGRILKPHLVIGGTTVDRVQAFKLLGEHMSSDLK